MERIHEIALQRGVKAGREWGRFNAKTQRRKEGGGGEDQGSAERRPTAKTIRLLGSPAVAERPAANPGLLPQSAIDNRQSTIDNRQSTIDNRQSKELASFKRCVFLNRISLL
jgi:hypothetical protein